MEVDVAIVGAGAAGLSIVAALDRLLNSVDLAPGARAPSVALIDPVHRTGQDRTWCFWDDGASPLESLIHRSWDQVAIVDRAGRQRRHHLGSLRYAMIRSGDFYAHTEDAAARIGAVRIPAEVESIEDDEDRAVVHSGDQRIRARWVFDSRPAEPVRAARTALLQHFRGWRVHFNHVALNPDLPVLMDFSVPQPTSPQGGTAFCYVLPTDRRTGLIEYTVFSRSGYDSAAYEEALQAYLLDRWGTGGARGTYTVEETEQGVIPMTDAVYDRTPGRRVFRIGTAGGATRPSTGYTFSTIQRQSASIAAALLAGRRPEPPAPHRKRHRWLDAVMLRSLDQGLLSGPDLFVGLFDKNPAERVLRFLDGTAGPAGDLALVRSAPFSPMLHSAAADLRARLRL